MRKVRTWLLAATLIGVLASAAMAAEWGDLSGQVLYDGPPPTPEKAKITSDQQVCGKHNVIDEALLVSPASKGVQNVIVFLYQDATSRRPSGDDATEVPIHESYEALKFEPVKLDNNGCRFAPHVALLWTARKLVVGNSDPIGHNVKIETRINSPSNDTIPSGAVVEKSFAKPERMPAAISCSIHPWMKGWLIIRDTPYMAATDEDGKFEIKNLPTGKWRFMFWQEAAGYLREVQVDGKPQAWSRGIVELEIKPGENDLGKIVVKPDLFK